MSRKDVVIPGGWSSRSGLKSEYAGYFSEAELLCLLRQTDDRQVKQLSMATIPLCFGFFRCRVDVLQG